MYFNFAEKQRKKRNEGDFAATFQQIGHFFIFFFNSVVVDKSDTIEL